MDLNDAMLVAKAGRHVRDEANMRPEWTMRWDADAKLFYYFDPRGQRAHVIKFTDAMRASFQWRAV
jgi:hypothetical protein